MEFYDIPRVYEALRGIIESKGRALPVDLVLQEFSRADKLYWIVDDVGLLIANQAGDMHGIYWDKRLRGREHLTKTTMLISMAIFGLDTAWTTMPVSERAALAFAKRLGFVESLSDGVMTTLTFTRGS